MPARFGVRLLLLAALSVSAAYRSGPSAFAGGVSHRWPSLLQKAARAAVPACAATPSAAAPEAAESERLPAAVLPITLTVFAQMIGEGLALTSLPLHMKSLGASTVMSGVAVSGFSLSSLLFTPVVVRISNRVGRYKVLRACLLGCALAQLLLVKASTPTGVVIGRFVCGIFAASVPVAQAAVTDLVPPAQSALALSRVSAVSQLGVVVGPAFGGEPAAVTPATHGSHPCSTRHHPCNTQHHPCNTRHHPLNTRPTCHPLHSQPWPSPS